MKLLHLVGWIIRIIWTDVYSLKKLVYSMSPILLQLLSFFDFRTLKLKVVSSSKTSVPHLFTPWSRILIKNLTGSQLVKKFPAFYGNLHFITAFTSASHLFQSWITYIQSMSLHSTSWRSTLILSSHLRLYLPSGLFPSGFSTRTLYKHILSPYVLYVQYIAFFSIWKK